jgi:hypothetical protein
MFVKTLLALVWKLYLLGHIHYLSSEIAVKANRMVHPSIPVCKFEHFADCVARAVQLAWGAWLDVNLPVEEANVAEVCRQPTDLDGIALTCSGMNVSFIWRLQLHAERERESEARARERERGGEEAEEVVVEEEEGEQKAPG